MKAALKAEERIPHCGKLKQGEVAHLRSSPHAEQKDTGESTRQRGWIWTTKITDLNWAKDTSVEKGVGADLMVAYVPGKDSHHLDILKPYKTVSVWLFHQV